MASIPLPVVTASDTISMRTENALEPILALCQSAAVAGGPGSATALKANLTLLNNALTAWTSALATQITSLPN